MQTQPKLVSESLVIEGGVPLRGSVYVSGAKNAALPCMAAALLTASDCYLENVPDIADVESMAQVLQSLGAEVERLSRSSLRINAANIVSLSPPSELVAQQRGSFLVMGALLARFGWAACSPPGGDVIGQRPIEVHLTGLEALGARISRQDEKFVADAKGRGLRGSLLFLDYPSVLGTENLLLAACLARGKSLIVNAACEPEIVCLADMLNKMGANIRGAGTHTIEVEGVAELSGATHRIIPDRIEAGTFAIAAAITGGEIDIFNANPAHLHSLIYKLRETGVQVEESDSMLRVASNGELHSLSVQAVPYPGLATDLQAPVAVLLTQARGVSYVHERVFDNRLLYISELRKMGAEVISTGTTAIITGPTQLVGAHVRALDVRAGAALILAALAARGTSEVSDIYHVDRGYEEIDVKLRRLGATVARIPQPQR